MESGVILDPDQGDAGKESDNVNEFARVNATHGWGLCTWDCGRGRHNADQLQIVDQTVLPSEDCHILSRS